MQQTRSTAYLIIHLGNRWSDILRIVPEQSVTIGRSSDCQIVVRDERVSRRHAEVAHTDRGWAVRDLGSRNGTLVGRERISGWHLLADGDVLQVGGCRITFSSSLSGGIGVPVERGVSGDSQRTKAASQSIIGRRQHSQWSSQGLSRAGGGALGKGAKGEELWSFFYRLVFDLVQAQRPSDAARVALERLLERLGATAGAVLVLDRKHPERSSDTSPQWRVLAHVPGPQGVYRIASHFLLETVLREGQAVLARNVAGDSQLEVATAAESDDVTSILCAPLRKTAYSEEQSPGTSEDSAGAPDAGRPASESTVFGVLHVYTTADNKPLHNDDLEVAVGVADNLAIALTRHAERAQLAKTLERTRRQVDALREQVGAASTLVGQSDVIERVREAIARAAPTTATVLIRGESGVGKELVARAIHQASNRCDGPMICINCAALAPSLLESELFGHEKGAFTGATERKLGKFEAADGGTLFLDEIGEMPVELQAKLLRVLDGQAFERIGGSKPIQTDVRIIAATNRDLEEAVREKLFRPDLYYRLRVIEIEVPPLRLRKEDIEPLAEHFLATFRAHANRRIAGFAPQAMRLLQQHNWPGNVRELRNVIERAVVLGQHDLIMPEDLSIAPLGLAPELGGLAPDATFQPVSLAELEKRHILATLEYTEGNKSKAAQLLGIERSTLDRKLKRYRDD